MFKVGFFSKNQYPSKPASTVHFVPVVTKHAKVVVASDSSPATTGRDHPHGRPAGPLAHRREPRFHVPSSRPAQHDKLKKS